MEDMVYEVCEVHGNVAWDHNRPWDAWWCCQAAEEMAQAEAAESFAEAVFGW